MRRFAAVRESRATFTEEKAIPELELPLPSRGTLRWSAPDHLEKITTDPSPERLIVAGDRLLLERPDQNVRTELSLDQAPEIRPLVEAIRATLAGDLATLRRYHEVGFTAYADDNWKITLVPLSVRVRAVVQRIVLSGTGPFVAAMETDGSGGTTRMWIRPAG
ncbi:outer membrane lipoprotein carrier protein LolA [Roseomonas sp. NAR14]|uniref:Outer membrane lipoprotein carrier protein LolA n=1 Tax=Roseomonas acroporae TaxID=2937791 RepID=A0A9X1YEA0_9PROT|nr:outer membrane lipoprotein carrier protein LolA [Roseomonas acroporae]MCK8784816.1 outer membrane lipoprotein carrier protein LolA [Roseomonas acroporae]